MENYKIRVESEAERSEATDLFKELGFFRRLPEGVVLRDFVCTDNDGEILYSNIDDNEKELTLPQLKDLVVLKRNDVGDATHVRGDGKRYFHAQSTDYFYQFGDDEEWVLSTWMNYQLLAQLQPIEPKMSILDTGRLEMREYLRKNLDGKYILELTTKDEAQEFHARDWIEVPVGAEIAIQYKNGEIEFFKENYSMFWLVKFKKWVGTMAAPKFYKGGEILWQRETLNDKVARGRRKTYGLTPEIASRISLKTEGAYMAVSETLKARQSTYGSFEDVASVTQDLLSILKKTGLESLPKPHKEAMHMICSKMARIVNGDFNHLDSWHDIGGYAKLIENLIGYDNENRCED